MHLHHWTYYKISLLCVGIGQSVSLSHMKRVERSTERNPLPIFAKLATEISTLVASSVKICYLLFLVVNPKDACLVSTKSEVE